MIDLCTHQSAAASIPNKNKETIIKHIFQLWIAVYSTRQKFLTDNGGEFANSEFLEMADHLGITVHRCWIPMEQWSCWEEQPNPNPHDRQNYSWNKHLLRSTSDLGIECKKSLQNVAGFSPFQLVLDTNPKLQVILSDNLPALSIKLSSQIVQENLNAIHSTYVAFIASENSERIWQALLHNVQTSSEVKYITEDVILHKRNDCNKWWGLGMVIGQIKQQVFVKHGSFYVSTSL